MIPTVSFVVPCYNLAHLLAECIDSILSQSYGDFEVLIMDDCSPDDTAEIAQSYRDPRVRYVRNEQNLGLLRNFNKGIALSRGKYVWLISADDYLRRRYVLQKYVELMERNPNVGYVFCNGVGVKGGAETGTLASKTHGTRDRIINGRAFLKTLLRGNSVPPPSAMVRRDCYEKISLFPLDMPWAGDWFLWCIFALHYDVAYFADPMIGYRDHALGMTKQLPQAQADACFREDISVPWQIKKLAETAGLQRTSQHCLRGVAELYAVNIVSTRYGTSEPLIDFEQFESSLSEHTHSPRERNALRAMVYAAVGNEYYWQGNVAFAKRFYLRALRMNPFRADVLAKRLLLALGGYGDILRKGIPLSFRFCSSLVGAGRRMSSVSRRS